MHGLLDLPHVDHLHPDSGIALATAADGEALTRACFGDRVGWLPWRRPGFQLGLDIAEFQRASPAAIGVILGGHGITAWGASSAQCEANSLEIIGAAQRFLDETGRPDPLGPVLPAMSRCPPPSAAPAPPSWRPSSGGWPPPTIPRSGISPTTTPCSASWPVPGTGSWPRAAPHARIISCARRSRR